MSERTLSQSRRNAPYFLLACPTTTTESTELAWNTCIWAALLKKTKKRQSLYAALITKFCIYFLHCLQTDRWHLSMPKDHTKQASPLPWMTSCHRNNGLIMPLTEYDLGREPAITRTCCKWEFLPRSHLPVPSSQDEQAELRSPQHANSLQYHSRDFCN